MRYDRERAHRREDIVADVEKDDGGRVQIGDDKTSAALQGRMVALERSTDRESRDSCRSQDTINFDPHSVLSSWRIINVTCRRRTSGYYH